MTNPLRTLDEALWRLPAPARQAVILPAAAGMGAHTLLRSVRGSAHELIDGIADAHRVIADTLRYAHDRPTPTRDPSQGRGARSLP